MTCTHEETVRAMEQGSAAYGRRGVTALVTSQINIDKKKAACQAECGEQSPWHGIELTPISTKAAAGHAARRRSVLHQDVREMAAWITAGLRRTRS